MACARHLDDVAARRGGHSPALGDQGEDQAREARRATRSSSGSSWRMRAATDL